MGEKITDKKITLGIFGGSFDPPHNGHVKLCEEFAKLIGVKVLVMPAKISPLKMSKMLCADDNQRLEMCSLAFSHIENVEISKYEIEKNDVSYTYKTVEHFLELNPDEKICLCIGADCIESLECWANAEYLFKNCVFVAAHRFKDGYNSFGEAITKLRIKYNAQIIPFCYEPLEISSTEIREKIALSEFSEIEKSYLIPLEVLNYIKENNLYRGE